MAHPALAGLNGLDWTDIRILEELIFLGQERGYSTPSRQYLANIIGCTIRTITRHLTKLVKLGYLQRKLRTHRTPDGKIRNQTSLYRVALDQAARITAFIGGFIGRATGGTPLSSKPKTENNMNLKKDTASPTKAKTADRTPPQPKPWEKPAQYSQSHEVYTPPAHEAAILTPAESHELTGYIGKARDVAARFLRLGGQHRAI